MGPGARWSIIPTVSLIPNVNCRPERKRGVCPEPARKLEEPAGAVRAVRERPLHPSPGLRDLAPLTLSWFLYDEPPSTTALTSLAGIPYASDATRSSAA